MKKILIISSFSLIFLLILFSVATLYLSFFKVKPVTLDINKKIEEKLSQIVLVPKGITRPDYTSDLASYKWEMETREKEVVAVELFYTPSYLRSQGEIIAVLRMVEGGDPSIFVKSLPALIKDQNSLKLTEDPKNTEPETPQGASFKKIKLGVHETNLQTIYIEWELSKNEISQDLTDDYRKLEKYPPSIFKVLYFLPQFFVDLFSGA